MSSGSDADLHMQISQKKLPNPVVMRAAGVLKPHAADSQDLQSRYVHVSLPATLMPRQAEQVRQLLGSLTRCGDVILYHHESDLNTLLGFVERYRLSAFPLDAQTPRVSPEHRIVILDAYDIDSSLHQIYDLHDARTSPGSRVICQLS